MVLPHGQTSQAAEPHDVGSWQDKNVPNPSTAIVDGKPKVSFISAQSASGFTANSRFLFVSI